MQGRPSSIMIKTRFAPSPTGAMHIGGVRTALYAYLAAKKNKGTFYLRIEDTDRSRFVEGSVEDIIATLKWLNLNFDEKPIFQSERKEIYTKYALELVAKDLAYKGDGAIWFKSIEEGKSSIEDLVGNRKIEFDNSTQKDFVILKSDGFPTYHLAHVVDDHLMNVDPVIRGAEWISSLPKHVMLFNAFGWEIPRYAHLPIILGPDKSKLSKRHGAKAASEFRRDGYLPEAILNYMSLLGWTPPSGKDIFSLEEMTEEFDLKDVNLANPIFDIKKLEWMNGVYIRKSQISVLQCRIKSLLQSGISYQGKISDEILNKFISLAQTRMTTLGDFYELASPYLEESKLMLNERERNIAKKLIQNFSVIEKWNNEAIFTIIKKTMEGAGVKMQIMYKIITGKESGLPLSQSLEIIGKDETIKRLNNSVL